MPLRSPKMLSLKEILILVLILTILTMLLFYTLGPNLGRTLSYGSIIVVTVIAIILKNIPNKQKLLDKFRSKPLSQ